MCVGVFCVDLLDYVPSHPEHLAALGFYVAMLLPTSGLIQHGLVSMSTNRYAYLPTMVVVPYASSVFARVLHAIDPEESSEPECEGDDVTQAIAPTSGKRTAAVNLKQNKSRPVAAIVMFLLFGTIATMSANLMDTWRNEQRAFQHILR